MASVTPLVSSRFVISLCIGLILDSCVLFPLSLFVRSIVRFSVNPDNSWCFQVVRHLIAAGHDVHVVTGAPDFVFTSEIQSPRLKIRKVFYLFFWR